MACVCVSLILNNLYMSQFLVLAIPNCTSFIVLRADGSAVHTLEDSNLEAIRAAVGLESKLQTLLGGRAGEGSRWAILERLTPLLHLWVTNQLSLVQSWYERIFATEKWQPVSQPRGCSRWHHFYSWILLSSTYLSIGVLQPGYTAQDRLRHVKKLWWTPRILI